LAPERLAKPNGYSHVVVAPVDSIVFVSGQVPLDAEGTLVGAGDVPAQARQVSQNLSIALEAAETTSSNVDKLNLFVRDVTHIAAVRTIRDQYVDTANR